MEKKGLEQKFDVTIQDKQYLPFIIHDSVAI